MKKIACILIIILPLLCLAQKQGNIWYFGTKSGLDFSNGNPIILTDGQTGTDIQNGDDQEGTACISDSSGKLLFYTGGKTIWNRNHIPMPNGNNLLGGVSSTQSSLIVPLPSNDSIFYVFTSDEFQSYTSPPEFGYRYNIVDMCLDNGNGDIIDGQKNILLLDSSTEKLAACEDENGNGYWIVGHKMFSNKFYSWHLTSGGITDTVVSKIGKIHGWDISHSTWVYNQAQGQMKFNSIGIKLALAINADPAVIELFNFNNSNGSINNLCHIVIDSALSKDTYGIEFSPDGTKLYAGGIPGAGGKCLYQFDITAGGGDCDSIIASRLTLFQSYSNSVMFGMQLTTNGKIYLISNDYHDLGCINFPNLIGVAANFDSLAISISGYNAYTLPNFIAGYKYHNGVPHCSIADGIGEVQSKPLANNAILYQNMPNPFGDGTIIKYFVPENANAQIEFYDEYGNQLKIFKIEAAGMGQLKITATNLAVGMYSYSLLINGRVVETKKMIKGK